MFWAQASEVRYKVSSAQARLAALGQSQATHKGEAVLEPVDSRACPSGPATPDGSAVPEDGSSADPEGRGKRRRVEDVEVMDAATEIGDV